MLFSLLFHFLLVNCLIIYGFLVLQIDIQKPCDNPENIVGNPSKYDENFTKWISSYNASNVIDRIRKI